MKNYVERNGNKGWSTLQGKWGAKQLRTMDIYPFSSWEQRRTEKVHHRWRKLHSLSNE